MGDMVHELKRKEEVSFDDVEETRSVIANAAT
jgi:hypothetical protein